MPTTTTLLPIGAPVAILADTFGEQAATGTIAGYVAYHYPGDTTRMEQGYAVYLDRPGYLDDERTAPANRPWVAIIVAHLDSVSAR